MMRSSAWVAALAAMGTVCAWNAALADQALSPHARVPGETGLAADTGAERWVIPDPFTSAWSVELAQLESDRLRVEISYGGLLGSGEGEAYQIFMRTVRRLAAEGEYAGYDILRYEEGIRSTWPFTRRVAVGEFRLLRSRIWPEL